MAKFCGMIGFASEEETAPDVFEEQIKERLYYGDVTRSTAKWENGESLNDNFMIRNDISILADSFAMNHAHLMRYVTHLGTKWEISSIELSYPRINISIGGVYNGKTGPAVSKR